jgi:hypothetical protein
MENNPQNHHFDSSYHRIFNQDPNIRKIEAKLRDYNLIWRPDIQKLLTPAHRGSRAMKRFALVRLQAAIDAYETQLLRKPDPFKPYGPYDLLSRGQLHLLTQIDGIKWKTPTDSLLTGALLLGPQDAGKSRFVINMYTEIKKADPSIKITIIDPKGGFTEYAGLLNAIPVDLNKCSFSINKVTGVDYRNIVLELMPQLADNAGLIYGTEIFNESAMIALDRLDKYEKATGQDAELSFQDIYCYLRLVEDTKYGRRSGYREAAETSLRRIMGENNLFACRKGLDLKWLFENDVILNARSITDEMQCRALALLLLYTRFQQCRYLPQTSQLRHLIIIDDSSRFVGNIPHQQNADSITPSYAHMLAAIRSSGSGVCCVTQLPGHMHNAFLALSRTMIVIGSMAGGQHLKVISDFMRLNEDQIKAVTRLSKREAVGFAPNTEFKKIFHGWVPSVCDPPVNVLLSPLPDLGIVPWQHLDEIPAGQQPQPEKHLPVNAAHQGKSDISQLPGLGGFSDNTKKLLWDNAVSPFNFITTRIKRLNMTVRSFEAAKQEAVNAGMLVQSSAGKAMFLIPTIKLLEAVEMLHPYSRNVSLEHSFYVSLFEHILKAQSTIRKTHTEFSIGQLGSTGDISTVTQSGVMNAYEITLNTSNLLDNAVKYKDSGYSKIIFLCRDNQLAKAVTKYFKTHSLDQGLMAKLEVTYFGQIFKNYRKTTSL